MNKQDSRLPYIQQGRIFHIPIVPQRLCFALTVQKAFSFLEAEDNLDSQDIIAVALPDSIRKSVLDALRHLPSLSLIFAQVNEEDMKEVFSVTPCDGMIEALRIGIERNLPFQFIDREISPGDLIHRHCISNPKWADDGYAIERGIGEYLNLVRHSCSRFPLRYEPLDTCREIYMATQLRRLGAIYRRVLFISPIQNTIPVINLLEKTDIMYESEEPLRITTTIWKPELTIMLRYLDDFPRLVQRYEESRSVSNDAVSAADFHGIFLGENAKNPKMIALLKEIGNVPGLYGSKNGTPLHYEAFNKILISMLKSEKHITPDPANVYKVLESCFGTHNAEKIREHLLGYFDEIDSASIRFMESVDSIPSDKPREYVSRVCNPIFHSYQLEPLREIKHRDDVKWWAWPLWREHHNQMRRRVFEKLRNKEKEYSSIKYQSSLEDGVDSRRTLLSYFRGKPDIFVKYQRNRRKFAKSDEYEPIVWIFDVSGKAISHRSIQRNYDERIFYWLFYKETRDFKDKNGEKTVNHYESIGSVSLAECGIDAKQIRSEIDEDFEKRMPYNINIQGAISSSSWLEQLFYIGINYSRNRVFYVKSNAEIPDSVFELARSMEKELCFIPLAKLGWKDTKKLADYYNVDIGRIKNHTQDTLVIDEYKEIMENLWL